MEDYMQVLDIQLANPMIIQLCYRPLLNVPDLHPFWQVVPSVYVYVY